MNQPDDTPTHGTPDDREIELCEDFRLPERLLLAHARGEALFITGAGTSRSAGLPDFRGLVLDVYRRVDAATSDVLNTIIEETCERCGASHENRALVSTLSPEQQAEVSRFQAGDYDVVLGMLERRMDFSSRTASKVRDAVAEVLRDSASAAASTHRSLLRLADRGASTVIVTTNFDLLLEDAAKRRRVSIPSLSLGAIPRPSQKDDFSGVLHIHGALNRNPKLASELLLTDQDFGEFYLRRRIVPDFLYDAARLYNLVLVGYSANDAPMRYLLNAVAADVSRFQDLQERFALVGTTWPPDDIEDRDWKGRGITPIFYPSKNRHKALELGMAKWAKFSAINGNPRLVDRELLRISKTPRGKSSDSDRDLFDHLIRRGTAADAARHARLISQRNADISWLDSILATLGEPGRAVYPTRRLYSEPRGKRNMYITTREFVSTRLAERATVEWALKLNSNRRAERLALENVFDHLLAEPLTEPWRTTWGWILEQWRHSRGYSDEPDYSIESVTISRLLKRKMWAGGVVERIVNLVRPCVRTQDATDTTLWSIYNKSHKRHPQTFGDLIHLSLTSGGLVFPSKLALDELQDVSVLEELGHALDAAVVKGLDIARRLGWKGDNGFWQLGGLNRVYFVLSGNSGEYRGDPDGYHHGIAPSVKLLHWVVTKLADLDEERARRFVLRWRAMRFSAVHARLWSAMARDERFATSKEVGELLQSCSDLEFWDISSYPEFAELRALRFPGLPERDQNSLLKRLKRRPPRHYWPKQAERIIVDRQRSYWAARELRRIEIAGGCLPPSYVQVLSNFPELKQMSSLEAGFPEGPHAISRSPNPPDTRFDSLIGFTRLRALETALRSRESGLEDAVGRARHWLNLPGNVAAIVADLESAPDAGGPYAFVWMAFASVHRDSMGGSEDTSNLPERVLHLLARLPAYTARTALEEITVWMSVWQKVIINSEVLYEVWGRLWPLAIEAASAQQSEGQSSAFDSTIETNHASELDHLSLYSTPVGHLVSVFLAKSYSFEPGNRPFDQVQELRGMRDNVAAATGRPRLIALARMLWGLPWFLTADPEWTRSHLITPLLAESPEALALWQAVAGTTLFYSTLLKIGEGALTRATDSRLRRETRESLAWSLVVEVLHAFKEGREPAVPKPKVQQMLRLVDDEVRTKAASAVQRFVIDHSKEQTGHQVSTPEELFLKAAKPFLEEVWPQERLLSTSGVAQAFARLPSACGEQFAEAVSVIERFLVPFNCWSLIDFGLDVGPENSTELVKIDNRDKAEAFLLLLDRSIGRTQNAVTPLRLDRALEHIRVLSGAVTRTPQYRRLAALARQRS